MNAYMKIYRAKPMCVLSLHDIMSFVSYEFGVPIESIRTRSRVKKLAEARKMFCWLSWELTVEPLKNIATETGYRRHDDAVHARDSLKNIMQFDKALRSKADMLSNFFKRKYIIINNRPIRDYERPDHI